MFCIRVSSVPCRAHCCLVVSAGPLQEAPVDYMGGIFIDGDMHCRGEWRWRPSCCRARWRSCACTRLHVPGDFARLVAAPLLHGKPSMSSTAWLLRASGAFRPLRAVQPHHFGRVLEQVPAVRAVVLWFGALWRRWCVRERAVAFEVSEPRRSLALFIGGYIAAAARGQLHAECDRA